LFSSSDDPTASQSLETVGSSPSTTVRPTTSTTVPASTTTTVEDEQAQIDAYLRGLAEVADTPPPPPPPSPSGSPAGGQQPSLPPPPPPPPAPSPPPPPPPPPPPAPTDNFGLPSNPFSHPQATFAFEIDRRPAVRQYYYNLAGGFDDWCVTLPAMIANAGYTVSYTACEGTVVLVSFYGQNRAGDAKVSTHAPGSASIELRA